MPTWTPQQQAAINDRGGTLLVSASAGSGKTAVLVERAVGLICGEDAIDADRLLILTFSNAAAAQLRSRIARRLEQAVAENPGNHRLRRQRMLLQKACISTVSAFCMQLLRENFSKLSIPPDFKVADDAKCYELSAEVLAEVLEESYHKPAFCEFASAFGRARTDAAAGQAVLDLYAHLRALPFFEGSLREMCELYHTRAPIGETVWGKELIEQGISAVDCALSEEKAALQIALSTPEIEGYAAALNEDIAQFERVGDLLRAGRWDDAAITVANYAPAPLKGAARGFDGAEKESVKQLRADAKDTVAELSAKVLVCTEEQFSQDIEQLSPLVDALADAVRLYDARFFAAKLADKVLEFSDFEHLALELVMDDSGKKTPLGQEISARFDWVMVDEYQDTNALQDMLYRKLANDEESNLFLVGDVKQSIYRFRKAMPEIFIEKKTRFAPYDGVFHPAALVLPHNFRSSQGVVDGINDFFGQLMCREIGEVDYRAGEQLTAGAPSEAVPGSTTLCVVDVTDRKLTGEADYVAKLIADWVEEKVSVRDEQGAVRGAVYSDFCILLRSPSASAQIYAAALEARGIPACADTDAALLAQPAVQPLLALLRVLDNPAQDVPLAAFLVSPAGGFSGTQLTEVRAGHPQGNLWSALCACENEQAQAVLALLRRLRRRTASVPVARLCAEALAATGYQLAAQVANGADAAAGQANLSALRALVAFAAEYDENSGGGLAGFVRMVDASLAAGRAVSGGRPAAPQGVVRIMSIHRSKGLEFPICILADTCHQFNNRDLSLPVLRHARLGIGMTLRAASGARYRTLPQMAIRFALEKEQMSEEMRILYVAMTRAKDHLVLTAGMENPAKKLAKLGLRVLGAQGVTPFVLENAQNFAQWLLPAALLHPDADELRRMADVATLHTVSVSGGLCVKLETPPAPPAVQEAKAEEPARTALPDEALLRAVQASLSWADPQRQLSRVPVKASVSALTHQTAEQLLKRPSFMYGEGLSAAEKGTALHTLLQYADFAALAADFEAEIARMTQAGYLLPEQASAIDRRALAAFVACPMFARLTCAGRLLREHAFFTEVPAGLADASLTGPAAAAPVLVQGIADCVLFEEKGAVLLDYKTDHSKTAAELADAYRGQLALYKRAIEEEFGVPVVRCCLYSFALGQIVEVDVSASPLAALAPG